MAESPKDWRVGVRKGGGPPPGYQWSVAILAPAFEEAAALLDGEQYRHAAAQFKALAREAEPTASAEQDVRPIEDYHELRDKGGVLGRINLRVFFGIDHERREIVVLHVLNKKNDGKTPMASKALCRTRWRRHRNRK